MRFIRVTVMLGAGLASFVPAFANSSGPTLQDRQQAACYNDVQRLCPNTIPDVAKTEACMKDKRSQVSEGCSKMWDVKQ